MTTTGVGHYRKEGNLMVAFDAGRWSLVLGIVLKPDARAVFISAPAVPTGIKGPPPPPLLLLLLLHFLLLPLLLLLLLLLLTLLVLDCD